MGKASLSLSCGNDQWCVPACVWSIYIGSVGAKEVSNYTRSQLLQCYMQWSVSGAVSLIRIYICMVQKCSGAFDTIVQCRIMEGRETEII